MLALLKGAFPTKRARRTLRGACFCTRNKRQHRCSYKHTPRGRPSHRSTDRRRGLPPFNHNSGSRETALESFVDSGETAHDHAYTSLQPDQTNDGRNTGRARRRSVFTSHDGTLFRSQGQEIFKSLARSSEHNSCSSRGSCARKVRVPTGLTTWPQQPPSPRRETRQNTGPGKAGVLSRLTFIRGVTPKANAAAARRDTLICRPETRRRRGRGDHVRRGPAGTNVTS